MDGSPTPADPERARQLAAADLAAVIERSAGDLAIAEEPAGFVAALEAGAPPGDTPGAAAAGP